MVRTTQLSASRLRVSRSHRRAAAGEKLCYATSARRPHFLLCESSVWPVNRE